MPLTWSFSFQRSHGILLGVVGSDVALRELMKLAPRYKVSLRQVCREHSQGQSWRGPAACPGEGLALSLGTGAETPGALGRQQI